MKTYFITYKDDGGDLYSFFEDEEQFCTVMSDKNTTRKFENEVSPDVLDNECNLRTVLKPGQWFRLEMLNI